MGTAGYMSPEQVRGEKLDARTDCFPLVWFFTKWRLGQRASSDAMAVPPKLEQVINKALEKDRERRYQHASEMLADLNRLIPRKESSRSGVRVGLSSRPVCCLPGGFMAVQTRSHGQSAECPSLSKRNSPPIPTTLR